MQLGANFSLPAAKPPAQRVGVAGWDAKIFGADSAPQMPPAPTPEQLMEHPFPPEILRFYLSKRPAERIHEAASAEGEVWRYSWGERVQEVKLPMPQDGAEDEQAAVVAIASVEGVEPEKARLYIAQVASTNWHEFIRRQEQALVSETPAEEHKPPTQGIPAFLLHMLQTEPTIRQTPPREPPKEQTKEPAPPPQPAPIKEQFVLTDEEKAALQQAADAFAPDCERDAKDWLGEAADILKERGRQYDGQQREGRERSMAMIVGVFNALHGTTLTVEQGWSFMLCLKLVRLFAAHGFHRDSAVDAIAYMALLAESKARQE